MNKMFNELKKFSNEIIVKEIRQIKVTLIMHDNSQLVWTQVALLVFILEPEITVALTGHERKFYLWLKQFWRKPHLLKIQTTSVCIVYYIFNFNIPDFL